MALNGPEKPSPSSARHTSAVYQTADLEIELRFFAKHSVMDQRTRPLLGRERLGVLSGTVFGHGWPKPSAHGRARSVSLKGLPADRACTQTRRLQHEREHQTQNQSAFIFRQVSSWFLSNTRSWATAGNSQWKKY